MIVWLRESMSRRNPSSRSASSPNVKEKTLLYFSVCWTPRKGLYRSSRHLKPISLAKTLHQKLKPKKIGAWEVTDIPKRCIKHHPFRHCLWRFFTSDDDLQCAFYRTLYSGRFPRKFCKSRRKVGTIPYCTVRMISRAGAQRTRLIDHGTATGAGAHSKVVWEYNWTVITRSSLAWENNGITQTGVTLSYTINPFGPTAGRVSRWQSICYNILWPCLAVGGELKNVIDLLISEGLVEVRKAGPQSEWVLCACVRACVCAWVCAYVCAVKVSCIYFTVSNFSLEILGLYCNHLHKLFCLRKHVGIYGSAFQSYHIDTPTCSLQCYL